MQAAPRTLDFRPDIEGLRALAILLVVACHTGVPGLQGGFIGVDVFFVISGYLITRLLYAEWQEHGQLDIAAFYARRMRRLLPAFGFVLVCSIVAIRVLYSPLEQSRMLNSAFSAVLYFSNLHFALDATDYMAPSARLDPLLHTWSLGVEEQFYLAWPVVVLAGGRLIRSGRSKTAAWLLAALTLVSFTACVLLTRTRQPLAFFLPLTRAWEFALGAGIAWWDNAKAANHPVGTPAHGIIAMAGLCLVLLSAGLLSEASVFPGFLAAAPAAGTALLLLARPAADRVGQLLRARPMQWLGKRSYGWYLWHWPLLVFGRLLLPEGGVARDLALALLALVAAQLSLLLVETPTRRSPVFRYKSAVLSLSFVIVSGSIFLILKTSSDAFAAVDTPRFQRLLAVSADLPRLYRQGCDGSPYETKVVACNGGAAAGSKTAVLIGDSHAGQWASAFDAVLKEAGWKLVLFTKSACPIVDKDFFYVRLGRTYRECTQWRNAALARIRTMQPDLVVVANSEAYPFSGLDWLEGVGRALAPIAASSRQVIVMRDNPVPGFDVPNCLARREWNHLLAATPCTFDATHGRSPDILHAYQAAARSRGNVHILDMAPYICRHAACSLTEGDIIKFRDGNHLSDTFVRTLAPALKTAITTLGVM